MKEKMTDKPIDKRMCNTGQEVRRVTRTRRRLATQPWRRNTHACLCTLMAAWNAVSIARGVAARHSIRAHARAIRRYVRMRCNVVDEAWKRMAASKRTPRKR